jgi:hypothetical protein
MARHRKLRSANTFLPLSFLAFKTRVPLLDPASLGFSKIHNPLTPHPAPRQVLTPSPFSFKPRVNDRCPCPLFPAPVPHAEPLSVLRIDACCHAGCMGCPPARYLLRYFENAPPKEQQYGSVSFSINTRLGFFTSSPSFEYCSLESLRVPPHYTLPLTDSRSDMRSLGMIPHNLVPFRLPYRWAVHGDHPGHYGPDAENFFLRHEG